MRFDAWLFRVGEVLALVAIYIAVGGPKIMNGGEMMGAAALLMYLPVLYRGIGMIRQTGGDGEVPA